jgi:flavodoxin
MQALIIYDSQFGNTEIIARSIGEELKQYCETKVVKISEADINDLESVDLLIVGSPTQGGMAAKPVQNWIASIPKDGLKGIKTAAFDTRIPGKEKGLGIKLLTGILGYAAGRIDSSLGKKGGSPAAPPEGFIVEDREGPLRDGETERAARWAREAAQQR